MKLDLLGSSRGWSGMLRQLAGLAVGAGLVLVAAAPAAGQMVMNSTDRLTFDRPESWALKYFTSATLLEGLETPRTRTPGAVSVGIEAGWLPSLSDAKQMVGYNGTESQDLNKAPFFPRPRITIGLPASFALIVSGMPPIPMFGLTTKLLALAIERPVIETRALTVGVRLYGQTGTVRGAYTCPASAAKFAPGSFGNPEGCEGTSADVASLRYAGGEISFAHRPDGPGKVSPHVAVGLSYMDVGFQVNAQTFGMIDRTHYLSHGMVVSASGGVSYRLSGRLVLGMDVFYSPLSVKRGFGAPAQNDGLFNVRTLLTYRLR